MAVKSYLPVVGILGLAACGGGGSDSCTTSNLDLASPASIATLSGDTRCYAQQIGSLVAVNPSNVTGDPQFNGVINISNTNAPGVGWTGQVELNYTSATGDLDGVAENFFAHSVDSQGFQTTPAFSRGGQITFDGTSGAGDTFPVTLGGTFDADGTTAGDAVTGSGTAAFVGSNSTTATAVIIGGSSSSPSTFTADSETYQFEVIAD